MSSVKTYLVNTPLSSALEGEKIVAASIEVSPSGALLFRNGDNDIIRGIAPQLWKSFTMVGEKSGG